MPSIISYTAAIVFCEKDEQLQRALQQLRLLAAMEEVDLVLNVIGCSAATGAVQSEQLLQALGLLAAMQEANMVLDVISYSSGMRC